MKRKASFRIDGALHEELKAIAQQQGITTSQLIELACYSLVGDKPKELRQIERAKKNKLEKILLDFQIDQPTFKQLYEITKAKNSTLSQEIYYRLSATLTDPIFDTMEFDKLESLHFDLNRLGNLFKIALDQRVNVDSDLLYEVKDKVKALSDEIDKALTYSYQRKF